MQYSFPPKKTVCARDKARDLLVKAWHSLKKQKGNITLQDFFPVDPTQLCKVIGWELSEVTMIGCTDSGLRIKARCLFDKKTIELDASFGDPQQRRFSIAHEIGHAILHFDTPGCIGGASLRTPSLAKKIEPLTRDARDIERQADIFATELLMPALAVKTRFKELFAVDSISPGCYGKKVYGVVKASSDDLLKHHDPLAIAKLLACHVDEMPSLRDFFNVSRGTMALRLIELSLVL